MPKTKWLLYAETSQKPHMIDRHRASPYQRCAIFRPLLAHYVSLLRLGANQENY